jgi:hypothetical protein
MIKGIKPFIYSLLSLLLLPSVYARESIFDRITVIFSAVPEPVIGKMVLFFIVFAIFWLVANAIHNSDGRERAIVAIIALLLAFISTIAIPDEIVLTIMEEYAFIVSFIFIMFPFALVILLVMLMHYIHKQAGSERWGALAGLFLSFLALVAVTGINRNVVLLTERVNLEWLGWAVSLMDVIMILLILYMGYFAFQFIAGPNQPSGVRNAGRGVQNMFRKVRREEGAENRLDTLEIGTERAMEGVEQRLQAEHMQEIKALANLAAHLGSHTINFFQSPQSFNRDGRHPITEEINLLSAVNRKLHAVHAQIDATVRKEKALNHRLVRLYNKENILIRKLSRDETRLARGEQREGDSRAAYEAIHVRNLERSNENQTEHQFRHLEEELNELNRLEGTLAVDLDIGIRARIKDFIFHCSEVIQRRSPLNDIFLRERRNEIQNLIQRCHEAVELEKHIISMNDAIHTALNSLEGAERHQRNDNRRAMRVQSRAMHQNSGRR